MNINYQLELTPTLSTVYGPADYREFREQLIQIDRLLLESGAEDRFLLNFVSKNERYVNKLPFFRKAFRTVILLILTNESYRDLAFRLADSDLFRWFIGVETLTGASTPSKSSIQRFEHIWDKEEITALIHDLNTQVTIPNQSEKLLFNDVPIEISELYVDSTCIKANIHHPVDWLLLRDAVRTLIGSIKLIRSQGLVHRMPLPDTFLSKINGLTIGMTQSSRNRNSKKERKKVFRDMKKVLKKVKAHAQRYYYLLSEKWHITDWSEKQTNQVLRHLSNVLDQIPMMLEIAHKRIISGKKVDNAEKILSLYKKDVHVIKRGKMDADVEFGNGFYLAEQKDGIIVDWDFFKDTPISDAQLLKKSIKRIIEIYKKPGLYATDRGFNSKRNDTYLEKENIFNATCPRNLEELRIKMKDDRYREAQNRRAQTEGRIGIFKNKFIGKKILRKGFENRESKIIWSILTHNLWVIARKANENYQQKILELSEAA